MIQTEERGCPAAEPLIPPWTLRVRTLFNRVTWGALPLVLRIPLAFLTVLIGFVATWKEAFLLAAGLGAFFVVLWAISCAILDLLGGLEASYLLSERGIHFAMGRRSRDVADAVAVVGALAGSATTAGAGLLARSEQEADITWREIRRVRVVEKARYVEVRGRLLSKPIGIYCTPENFEAVREIVRIRASASSSRDREQPKLSRTNPR